MGVGWLFSLFSLKTGHGKLLEILSPELSGTRRELVERNAESDACLYSMYEAMPSAAILSFCPLIF